MKNSREKIIFDSKRDTEGRGIDAKDLIKMLKRL